MLEVSRARIEAMLDADALVLDVGGWASPLGRADWVIDLMPYESRGLYGPSDTGRERFDASTWVERDICDAEPWPFADEQFDFAVCSHTLEDVRDPVRVCAELSRVARAGYVEVPSRLEEQSWGVIGEFAGWSHHRWLVELGDGCAEFVFKPHHLHGDPAYHLAAGFAATLSPAERVQTMFWRSRIDARERIFLDADELDAYLAEPVLANRERLASLRPGPLGRLRARLGRPAR